MKYSKRHLLFILLISAFLSPFHSAAQIIDNFSDGNFSEHPQWLGATSDFIVNESYQLQLNASIAGSSHLFLSQTIKGETEWAFYIKQNFSPSSNNYSRIYLLADDSSLINSKQAIYLQFGESGSNDVIELVKQQGDDKNILLRGTTSIASSFELNVKVRRSDSGRWTLYLKPTNANKYIEEGTVNDNIFFSDSFFGIHCKYSKSNRTRFFFDDIYIGPHRIDNKPPRLTSFSLESSDSINLIFSEPLDTLTILNPHNYSINNGNDYPDKIIFDQNWRSVNLTFNHAFEQNVNTNLKLRGLKDLANNTLKDTLISFTYYQIDTADIVINEVLFDPLNGGEEYVEIYNRSEKFLRLDRLKFFRIKKQFPHAPDTTTIKLTNENIIIKPHEYWVISKSPDKVVQQYFTENQNQMIRTSNLPSLLNDEGILGLVSSESLLIDKIYYSEKMHHPLLNFTDGVALERIHYDQSGYAISNWHSAASNNGFGTPTYQNSQFREFEKSQEIIQLSSKVITPDNDGQEDVLTINYSLTENGCIANVIIFNSHGQQISYLVNNEYLGTRGSFVWNGTNDQNQIQPMGIYVIYIELLDLNGELKKIRKTVVLSRLLN